MRILLLIYLASSLSVSGWFATAAYKGWKTGPLVQSGGSSPYGRSGGYYHSGGGIYHTGGGIYHTGGGGFRTSGGSWGGGK
jgi:hypothetical protein